MGTQDERNSLISFTPPTLTHLRNTNCMVSKHTSDFRQDPWLIHCHKAQIVLTHQVFHRSHRGSSQFMPGISKRRHTRPESEATVARHFNHVSKHGCCRR